MSAAMDITVPRYVSPINAYKDIFEQCVADASFLWILRSVAVKQPHYNIRDIQELEQRIESQLDGIMTSLHEGWSACESALALEEPGEVFTATVIAIRSHEMANIKKAVEVGLANEESIKGLISALGWLPEHLTRPWIERFLSGKDMNHKYLGIAACSVRRQDPGDMLSTILQRDDCLQHEKLHARALRLIGELRRQDLMPAIVAAIAKTESEEVKFWAIWSAILLGNKSAVKQLQPYVFQDGPNHERAIQLAFRVLPIEEARNWVSRMAENSKLGRSVIKATGILGDPHAVNWLIAKMRLPVFSRLAGESFTLISGLSLEEARLSIDPTDELESIPNDEPGDDDVSMDEDENLPWPDTAKVAAYWQAFGKNFIVGQRYFMGQPITIKLFKDKLVTGCQRQRHAAALELALTDSDLQLINTKRGLLHE